MLFFFFVALRSPLFHFIYPLLLGYIIVGEIFIFRNRYFFSLVAVVSKLSKIK